MTYVLSVRNYRINVNVGYKRMLRRALQDAKLAVNSKHEWQSMQVQIRSAYKYIFTMEGNCAKNRHLRKNECQDTVS